MYPRLECSVAATWENAYPTCQQEDHLPGANLYIWMKRGLRRRFGRDYLTLQLTIGTVLRSEAYIPAHKDRRDSRVHGSSQ